MPLNLELRDVSADLGDAGSVLVVVCPICPQVSLAMQEGSPWMKLFETGLKTPALEEHVSRFRESLEQKGVRTGAFTMRMPVPMMCLWTEGQRARLRKRARPYDAVVVLGCESATHTVRQALEGIDCRVLQAMRTLGITNTKVGFRFPMTIELRESTRVRQSEAGGEIHG